MTDRRTRLLGTIDVSQGIGVEIGALHSPIVARSEGRIITVDYASAETLRANLRHADVSPADVLEVDVIWGGLPLVDLVGHQVDYVLASHVIEHVPDLIGWLLEIAGLLRHGGVVGLAIPDRSRTFDLYRSESTIAEMVEAFVRGYKRPSLRQIFDSAAFSKGGDDDARWRPGSRGGRQPQEVLERLSSLFQWARGDLATSEAYIDVHCWVFTPASFLDVAEALSYMQCFPFRIAAFYPTESGSIEFQVRLERIDAGELSMIEESIARARTLLPVA